MLISQSQLGAVLLAYRRSANSTEVVLELEAVDYDLFWLEVWNMNKHLGYVCFARCPADEPFSPGGKASFVLTELLSANSPAPSPLVSLSGVLWNRLAALEASAEPPFSLLEEDWTVKPRALSLPAGFPHEA